MAERPDPSSAPASSGASGPPAQAGSGSPPAPAGSGPPAQAADGSHFRRLEPRTYGRDIATSLRAAILEGRLRSGSPLVERRIAEEMGVSRAPVREALRKLEEEGLVVTLPYKGTYVTQVTPRMIDEILSLRTVLEGFALQCALPRLASGGSERLVGLLQHMVEAVGQGDEDALVEHHMAFHRTFYELADHGLLLQFWNMMESQLRLYDRVHQQAYDTLDQYVEAHREIILLLRGLGLPQLEAQLPRLREALVSHITDKVSALWPAGVRQARS